MGCRRGSGCAHDLRSDVISWAEWAPPSAMIVYSAFEDEESAVAMGELPVAVAISIELCTRVKMRIFQFVKNSASRTCCVLPEICAACPHRA